MATSTPQDDYMKTALRLPRDLHARIQEAAAASGKSLNSELIARLEESFGPSNSVPKVQYQLLEQQVQAMTKAVDASKRLEGNLHRIIEIERTMSVMFAKAVIGLGDRLRGVLGVLDDAKDSPQIQSLRVDVLNAMASARALLKHSKTPDDEIDFAMAHTTVSDLAEASGEEGAERGPLSPSRKVLRRTRRKE